MAFHRGPKIVTDGLVLMLDAANPKSYSGSGSVVNDLSGFKSEGQLNGVTIVDNSFSFNSGDGIGLGLNGGVLNVSPGSGNEISVSAWIKPTVAVDSRAPIVRINNFYFQVVNDSRLETYWYGRNPEGYHSSSNSIVMDEWQFVTVVWSLDDVKFYINGILDTTISSVLGTGNTNNWVNIGKENSYREYEGLINLPSIYNKALTNDEVSQNYNAIKSRFLI